MRRVGRQLDDLVEDVRRLQGLRGQGVRLSLRRHVLRGLQGLLPAEHPEADRVPVPAGRKVSGDPAEPEPVPVLPVQEVPGRRDEPGL